MERVEINGTSVAFRQSGAGSLALFVHGFGLDSRMWESQLTDLADLRWCVAPDLRGRGRSASSAAPAHPPELLADDLAALIVALGGHLADVVGFSMGGYAALALTERHPRVVRTLTLVDSRSTADGADGRLARDAAVAQIERDGRPAFADEFLPKLLSPSAVDRLGPAVRTMIEETPSTTLAADLRGMRDRPDRTAVLEQLAVPCLALVGDQDVLTPPADSDWIAAHTPNGRAITIADAGHMAPMEQPGAINGALRELWDPPLG